MDGAVEFVKDWARVIVAAGLMAGVVDMLCPAGSFRQAVRLVMGLIVLIAVVSPVVALVSGGLPVTTGRVSVWRSPAESGWTVAADQMAAGLSAMLGSHPRINYVQVAVEPGKGDRFDISRISVRVVPARTPADEDSVEPIFIGAREISGDDQLAADVTTAIMLYTGLDVDRILVTISHIR